MTPARLIYVTLGGMAVAFAAGAALTLLALAATERLRR